MCVTCELDNEGGREGICHLVCSYNPIWAGIRANPGLTLAQQTNQTNITRGGPFREMHFIALSFSFGL